MEKNSDISYGIKFLMPYLAKHRRLFVVIFIAMLLVAATSALSAYIFKHILNDIFIAKDERMLWVLPLIVVTLFSVRGLSRFVSTFLTTRIGVSVANALRRDMFTHLLNAEYQEVQKITTGDINALIIQTALNIQNSIAKTIPQLIISGLTIVALVVVILYTDWHLALYAITVGVLIVVPIKILGKGVKRHTSGSEEMVSQMANRINETFNNFDLVKVYAQESYEQSLFSEFLLRYEKFQIKLAKYQLLSSPFMEFFIAVAIAVVIYIGGHSVVDGDMTAGDFFAFLIALTMLYAPIKTMTQNIMALYTLNGYIYRAGRALLLPFEARNMERDRVERIDTISFDKVCYSIGGSKILHNISFEINQGEKVAIVGKSGAGKSSIISLLFGLGYKDSGEITINKNTLDSYSIQDIRAQISYVNQRAGVFNDTIQANILYGMPLDNDRYERAKEEAQCDFIELLKDKDMSIAGEFGNLLSGGQRQRIALARAIYHDGSLLVLDEATSALDADTEHKIQQSMEQIMKNRTTIVIAHRLSTIEQCDKVIVMEAGHIVAYGSYDEVSQGEAFLRNFRIGVECAS